VIEIVTIETPSLGDRTYLATDGVSALVIDPQRDIDRVLAVAAARGVEVTHAFETHIHNDYVSGGLALARRTGAAYHVNAADTAVFTGGSPLYGSTGRPDLLGAEHTLTLAAAQHASARRLAEILPDRAAVYPTHGFGSHGAAPSYFGSGPDSYRSGQLPSHPIVIIEKGNVRYEG
jgi:hydroxyacylglutathione hydrolase